MKEARKRSIIVFNIRELLNSRKVLLEEYEKWTLQAKTGVMESTSGKTQF